MRKQFFFLALIIAGILSFQSAGCGPKPSGTVSMERIDIRSDPHQEDLSGAEIISLERKGYEITITPLAGYELEGIVLSRKNYGEGWNSTVSPCDLAIAWDRLVVTGLFKQIEWSQSGRWYYWRYTEEFPFDNGFIVRYSSNTHIIPANDNIRSAVRNVSAGDTVALTGFLVNVAAGREQNSFWWNSSLSRNDTGDGSCEIMYLTGIRYCGMSYE